MILAVSVTKDGEYFVGDQKVDEPQLIAKLKESAAHDPSTSLVLSADRAALHGQVVHVVDLAKVEGITKFAINVQESR
jgi:biopolymer transport protein ExbD